jgi:glutamyl/glutaminyl-tRNA synthetase
MKFTTRVAPSPTGDFHLGTARTAYFNWLAARSSGGQFILRIDDTDTSRNSYEAVEIIFKAMEWLGLDYDSVFYQSDRFKRYHEMANALIADGYAYADDSCIKLNPRDIPDSFQDDIVGRVPISDRDKAFCNGLILIKSDKSPTYHFASVVDDYDFNVNWIIRGNDHLANTAKHIAIYGSLLSNRQALVLPKFSHVGLIHKDKKKLSKRDDTSSIRYYMDNDFNPDAVLNFILRMGWGPKVDDKSTAIIDKKQALTLFIDHGNMRAAPANYDEAKLLSFDRKYKAMIEKSKVPQ